jgi:hypothetical protein
MKNGDFPVVTLVYQRVGIMYGRYLQYIGSWNDHWYNNIMTSN